MTQVKNIFAVSLVAIMVAGAANAKIASTTYVDNELSPVSEQVNTNKSDIASLKTDKEAAANKLTDVKTYSADKTSTSKFPSMAVANDMIEKAVSEVSNDASAALVQANENKTAIDGLKTDKQDKLTAGTNITIAADGTISATDTTYTTGNTTTAGLTKLYTATGTGTDGTMTQAAITTQLNAKADKTTVAADIATAKAEAIEAAATAGGDAYAPKSLVATVTEQGTAIDGLKTDKQDKLTAGDNINIAADGTISATDTTYTTGNTTTAGLTKLYTATGTGTDGTMTQAAITTQLDRKVATAQGDTNKNKAMITDATGAVVAGEIATGMIANAAVSNAKLAADAVTETKIQDGAVTSAKIADGTIVNADIAADAKIAQSKIDGLVTALAEKLTTPAETVVNDSGTLVLTYNTTSKAFAWESIDR